MNRVNEIWQSVDELRFTVKCENGVNCIDGYQDIQNKGFYLANVNTILSYREMRVFRRKIAELMHKAANASRSLNMILKVQAQLP